MSYKKDEYIEAIKKSLTNAEELFEEAKLLRENNKLARAYTLFQISIEEIGKAAMTNTFLMNRDIKDGKEVKEFLRNFSNHTYKTNASMGIGFTYAIIQKNLVISKAILNKYIEYSNKIDKANINKNHSLYTSIIDNKFLMPSEIITEKQVIEIEEFACLKLRLAKPYFDLLLKNIDYLYDTRNDYDHEVALKDGLAHINDILHKK